MFYSVDSRCWIAAHRLASYFCDRYRIDVSFPISSSSSAKWQSAMMSVDCRLNWRKTLKMTGHVPRLHQSRKMGRLGNVSFSCFSEFLPPPIACPMISGQGWKHRLQFWSKRDLGFDRSSGDSSWTTRTNSALSTETRSILQTKRKRRSGRNRETHSSMTDLR